MNDTLDRTGTAAPQRDETGSMDERRVVPLIDATRRHAPHTPKHREKRNDS